MKRMLAISALIIIVAGCSSGTTATTPPFTACAIGSLTGITALTAIGALGEVASGIWIARNASPTRADARVLHDHDPPVPAALGA